MGVVVKLDSILEPMDLPGEWESFLDPETGEIVSIGEEVRFALDREDRDGLSAWLQEAVERIERLLDSGRALGLPDSYDIHEWELMRRFSSSIDDPAHRDELLAVLHGRGAFRLFRMTVARLGLRDAWFEHRARALRRIAVEWLDDHGIHFVEADGGDAP
jgi:hypothetical protein